VPKKEKILGGAHWVKHSSWVPNFHDGQWASAGYGDDMELVMSYGVQTKIKLKITVGAMRKSRFRNLLPYPSGGFCFSENGRTFKKVQGMLKRGNMVAIMVRVIKGFLW